MESIFTPEFTEKAKQVKSAEELLALAKGNGINMTEEAAKAYFGELSKAGELSDEELGNVSGGGWFNKCMICGCIFTDVGDKGYCRLCGEKYNITS